MIVDTTQTSQNKHIICIIIDPHVTFFTWLLQRPYILLAMKDSIHFWCMMWCSTEHRTLEVLCDPMPSTGHDDALNFVQSALLGSALGVDLQGVLRLS